MVETARRAKRVSGYDAETNICWQFLNKGDRDLRCKCPAHRQRGEERILAYFGRCRSGRRWFWSVAICFTEKETFGWANTEDEAMVAATDAVRGFRTAGLPMLATVFHGWTSIKLKQINAAKRAARPPSDTKDSKVVEYLYGHSLGGEDTSSHPVRFRITKKTRKRVFYIRDAEWLDESGEQQQYNGRPIVSDRDGRIGYVNRQKLEADGSVENRGVHWSDYDLDLYQLFEGLMADRFRHRNDASPISPISINSKPKWPPPIPIAVAPAQRSLPPASDTWQHAVSNEQGSE